MMENEKDFHKNDKEFMNLVKKAKRKSILKNVIVSFIVTSLVLFGLYALGSFVMQAKINQKAQIDDAWNSLHGANIESQGTSYNYTPVSAIGTTTFVKKVAGVPVPWGKRERMFTIIGTSRLLTTDGASGSGYIEDERIPIYFQGEREVEFYHPKVYYKNVFDDRQLLNEMNESTLVEFAFSFDRGYTLDEVQQVFKEHLAWYWVDTFSDEEIKDHSDQNKNKELARTDHTTIGSSAYGFLHYPEADTASNFISTLNWLKSDDGDYQQGAEELYRNIAKGKSELKKEDLKIIGVVVTGSPSELKKYNNQLMIKGATIGATTDKY
ncbi:anti sigma factor C-terminal domain-containing protein [Bacillus suaedaesalsae]|uniref:Anti sigma factor C-terminal domain-containing protein n=1 Tax=Bacillus suaedaesalsae TaxID=2810349 RepID=A0ABS2DCU8_9BACI|nr:anti sigma factor C-terminal domain-containing protein [Bacillus suaedaesalsae]MBM6616285.1 anti sigma factor C-terminal domain-containing protein [Bacillus suaedaesalsae]